MKTWIGAAAIAAVVSLGAWTSAPALAAPNGEQKVAKATEKNVATATDVSARRRHHHYRQHAYHSRFYGPRYGYARPYYRSYVGPTYYSGSPAYRPYGYARPAYYGSSFYGPRPYGYGGYRPYGGYAYSPYGYGPGYGFGGGPLSVGFGVGFGGW